MRYWIDWLLRESVAIVAINVLALGTALLARRVGAHLELASAGALAVFALFALTVLNAASARRHAEPKRLLYWPGFVIYELLAVTAAWAMWSLGGVNP